MTGQLLTARERGTVAPGSWSNCPHRQLANNEIENGRRFTGRVLHGTARTAEDDPRFDKTSAPADSFAPNGPAVWAVLDQFTWCTMADARRLARKVKPWLASLPVELRDPRDTPTFYACYGSPCEQLWYAADAAGGFRPPDHRSIWEICRNIGEMVRPVDAGHVPGEYSAAAARWDELVACATSTAHALLVADRPELTDTAFDYHVSRWQLTFPDTAPPRKRAPS